MLYLAAAVVLKRPHFKLIKKYKLLAFNMAPLGRGGELNKLSPTFCNSPPHKTSESKSKREQRGGTLLLLHSNHPKIIISTDILQK